MKAIEPNVHLQKYKTRSTNPCTFCGVEKETSFNPPTLFPLQRSCGKLMFLHLSVSHSVHRGVSASGPRGWDVATHPPGRHSPWADTPGQTPPGQTPPWANTPLADTPCPVHVGIWSTSDGTQPTGMLFLLKVSVHLI